MSRVKIKFRLRFLNLQSSSKVLGRLPFLPLLFLPPPAPGPMLIKTLMFVRVIVLLYPNIEQGGRGIFSKRENSLFSGLKWTTVKLYSLPNYFCLWLQNLSKHLYIWKHSPASTNKHCNWENNRAKYKLQTSGKRKHYNHNSRGNSRGIIW